MDPFDLEDTFDEDFEIPEDVPDGWTSLTLTVPDTFLPIFQETLEAYKKLRETDKDFPALEAIILEAKNSLSSF